MNGLLYIEGLDMGEVSITLELLDNDAELIEIPLIHQAEQMFWSKLI